MLGMKERGGGRYHDFPLKMFCLAVPKNFVREPFLVSEKNLVSKLFINKRGGITIFRRNIEVKNCR